MDFASWLEIELDKRGWSRSDLARRGDLTTAQVSRVMTRQQNPGEAFCKGVAKALGVPLDEVYRAAGKLPKISYRDSLIKRIEQKASQLKDPRNIEKIEKIIDMLADDEDAEKKRSPRSRSATSSL